MKKELFCEIMENVDNKYIKEYYEKRFTTRSQRIKKYVLAAGVYAAAVLVIAVVLPFIIKGGIEPKPSVQPNPPVVTETTVTTEEPTPNPETESNITSYMNYLVNYFHDPYKTGDPMHENVLSMVSLYLFSNMDNEAFDFVEVDENSLMRVNGDDFRRVAKNLLGEDFKAEDYHKWPNSGSSMNRYNEENDTYTYIFATDYWGGDHAYADSSVPFEIKENGNTVTVSLYIYEVQYVPYTGEYLNKKATYTFEKVEDDDFTYYRILEMEFTGESYVYEPEEKNTDTLEIDWVFENFDWGQEIPVSAMDMSFQIPHYFQNRYPADGYANTTYERYDEESEMYLRGLVVGTAFRVDTDFEMDEKIWEYCTPVDLDNIESSGAADLSKLPVKMGITANGYNYVQYGGIEGDDMFVYLYVRIAEDTIIRMNYWDEAEMSSLYDRFLDSIEVGVTVEIIP